MNTAEDVTKGDEARAALVSDVRELKAASRHAVTHVESKLRLVIGATVGVIALGGVALALKPQQRRWFPARTSFVGKALRSVALSVVAVLARRLVTQAMDRALPEKPVSAEPQTNAR